VSAFNGNSGIFVSRGGALVTDIGDTRGRLAWASRDGHAVPLSPQVRDFASPKLSPDERRVAVVVSEEGKHDVWIYDLALATFSRLTSIGTVTAAEWSPDGTRIFFTAGTDQGRSTIWSQLASGGTPPEKLFEHAILTAMATISPDGKSLLANCLIGDGWGILRVPLDSERVARPYLVAKGINEHAPQFSPDGKWVALVSDESGRDEVYVRSFPDPTLKIQVSAAGAEQPAWSRDGSRLYYQSGPTLLGARVSLKPTFALVARDTVLSNINILSSLGGYFSDSYQATREPGRFLAVTRDRNDFQLVVSPNWITELRRRVAEGGGKE